MKYKVIFFEKVGQLIKEHIIFASNVSKESSIRLKSMFIEAVKKPKMT